MPRYPVVLVTLIVFLLTACSGNNTTTAPAAPVFTSTPVTQAVEGSPYNYQLAVNGTAAVTFSLTNAPTGATLSGNDLVDTHGATVPRFKQLYCDCDCIRRRIGNTVLDGDALRYHPHQLDGYVVE